MSSDNNPSIEEVDGVIKYKTKSFLQECLPASLPFQDIEDWRYILFQLKLIGEYDDGIGFGNISKRYPLRSEQFIITSTQTGKQEFLGPAGYSHVSEFDLINFTLSMQGKAQASSEALTHAAIYQVNPEINYIFHIHHRTLWNKMLEGDYKRIPETISYGTIEMANAFAELTKDNSIGIIVMAGHQDGILAYGNTARNAGSIILDIFNKLIL